jgi:putative PIN family toxin of toxin-antitoxin system
LLGGKQTLPVLEAWLNKKFEVVVSQSLLDELDQVWQRPRLRKHISAEQAATLMEQLKWRGVWIEVTTIPPRCRDPKDHPVLVTAIDGQASAIVSGDADLRADDKLRQEMAKLGVELWGIRTLLSNLED